MNRWVRAAVAASFVVAALAPVAEAAPRPQAIAASNRLFMVSDSVGLGAVPAMKAAFGAAWQVTITGKPGLFTQQLVTYVQQAPASAFGESAIVATGYNYAYWDPPRFDREIDLMVAALKARGVTRIYWVTIREVKPAYYSRWSSLSTPYRTLYLAYPRANDQLRRALTRHPEMSIIDWAAISDMNGLTYDAIHLNATGAAKYSSLARNTVVSGRTRQAARTVSVLAVTGQRGMPADAAAVVVNLTVINPRSSGYLTVYPCDRTRPLAFNIWYRPNQTIANTAVVPIGPAGTICVYQSEAAHVTVDQTGYIPAGMGFGPAVPTRALDTRTTGAPAPNSTFVAPLGGVPGVPTGPFTAIVAITTTATTATQVRAFTCGWSLPPVPTRTVEKGFVQTVLALVRTDATGNICLQSTGSAQFAVDLLGALPASADLRPFTDRKLYDTGSTPLATGVARQVTVGGTFNGGVPAAPTTRAAFLNLTITPFDQGGVLLYPCAAGSPRTPFVQAVPNHPQTNAGLVAVDSAGTVCLRATVGSRGVVDISGWSGTAVAPLTQVRLLATNG